MIDHLVNLNTPPHEMAAVKTFVELLEPDGYHRLDRQIWINQGTPLVGLAEAARPDSRLAREWMDSVSVDILARSLFAHEPIDSKIVAAWKTPLATWREAARIVLAMGARWEYVPLREAKIPAEGIAAATQIALDAIDALAANQRLGRDWRRQALGALDHAAVKDLSGTVIPFLPKARLLAVAASEPISNQSRSLSECMARLEALAEPDAP
jgi:hypothetical protein